MTFTRLPTKGRAGTKSKNTTRTPVPSTTMRTFGGGTKQTGKARALSRVKNATARAAISKSKGKTFPAGKLAAQAKRNIRSMIGKGGSATTRIKNRMPSKAIAKPRKAKR